MQGFTREEKKLLQNLNTPAKVQDFLNSLYFNFEKKGETLKSPLRVLREGEAHCLEGAILAAYVFKIHGQKPALLHLKSVDQDYDHVVAPFKVGKFWGAVSKTNHAVLRYREPVYKNIRELAMSYFHEYFLDNGKKTLRQYSAILNLNNFEKGWEISETDLWGIDEELDLVPHYDMVPKNYINKLRRADEIEIRAGRIKEYN